MPTGEPQTQRQTPTDEATGTRRLHIIRRRQGEQTVREALVAQRQVLLPMLELIEPAQARDDESMGETARPIEHLRVRSAQEVAGVEHEGRAGGAMGWHGMQHGRIALAERKLRMRRSRLRGKDGGGEAEVRPPGVCRTMRVCAGGCARS